jgi:hypothetical protein
MVQVQRQLQNPVNGRFVPNNRGNPNGVFTPQANRARIAARLAFGIKSSAPVLPGIESHKEWQQHLNGYIAVHSPVGIPEHDCVEGIANCWWKLRRQRRWLTGKTLTELYHTATLQPPMVRKHIERLLGDPVIMRTLDDDIEVSDLDSENTQNDEFRPDAGWWNKVMDGSLNKTIPHNEALWLIEYLATEVSRHTDEQNETYTVVEEPGAQIVQIPDGPVTVRSIRTQLKQMDNAAEGLVTDIISTARAKAAEDAEADRLAEIEARRFITEHLIPCESTVNSALWLEKSILSALTRYTNLLRDLQDERLGRVRPSLDVNIAEAS